MKFVTKIEWKILNLSILMNFIIVVDQLFSYGKTLIIIVEQNIYLVLWWILYCAGVLTYSNRENIVV